MEWADRVGLGLVFQLLGFGSLNGLGQLGQIKCYFKTILNKRLEIIYSILYARKLLIHLVIENSF